MSDRGAIRAARLAAELHMRQPVQVGFAAAQAGQTSAKGRQASSASRHSRRHFAARVASQERPNIRSTSSRAHP